MLEGSCCSISLPAIGIFRLQDLNYVYKYAVVSHCFNLQFSSDQWCWTSYHILIFLLCIFPDEVFKVFGPCFNWVVALWLSCKCSFHTLGILSCMYFEIFSSSVWVSILTVTFTEQVFNFSKVQLTNIFFPRFMLLVLYLKYYRQTSDHADFFLGFLLEVS